VAWPRALTGLGDASYALYLTHYPALSAVAKAFAALGLAALAPPWALWLAMLALVVAGGVAFHRIVERRLLGLGAPAGQGIGLRHTRRSTQSA
jgi:peptidoglycan/LPS O-acetylase OafA/YrhL